MSKNIIDFHLEHGVIDTLDKVVGSLETQVKCATGMTDSELERYIAASLLIGIAAIHEEGLTMEEAFTNLIEIYDEL